MKIDTQDKLRKLMEDNDYRVAVLYRKMAVIKEEAKVLSVPEKFTQLLRLAQLAAGAAVRAA